MIQAITVTVDGTLLDGDGEMADELFHESFLHAGVWKIAFGGASDR
jgi:hypothetical protein